MNVSSLGLSLSEGEDEFNDDDYTLLAQELSWVTPRLAGVFQGVVNTPPDLIVGELIADEVEWHLDVLQDETTSFTAILGESVAAELDRVATITFVFDSGRRTPPAYPYHLNTLIALSFRAGKIRPVKAGRRLRSRRRGARATPCPTRRGTHCRR